VKKQALQILLVEDNVADALLLREMFTKERPGSFEFTHFLRMSEALIHLEKGGVDIVLLDMGLPDAHGVDTVHRTHAVAPGVPVIVLTGLDDEAVAAEAMKAGAQDYLIKGQIENRALPRALRHAIERHRLQTETDLIRTHQLQFKDEFLSHVSHELRSPLTAIYQFVTILTDRLAGELAPEQDRYLEIVLRNVKQLESMIDDLLEVTRVQAGKLMIEVQCTSAADAIDYAVNTLQGAGTAKGIALSSEVTCESPLVCADPTRLRQLLIILLDNAIKFTPQDGTVKVQARALQEGSGFLILEISDSGCGIAPDMTERIFERLLQASDPALAGRKGLGLGLYICKELVTRQGGKIWATSTPGEGSVFSVTLPLFSLSNLIAPALTRQRLAEDPITLVMVEVGSRIGWLSADVRAEHSHSVRELLRGCLRSHLDVLLPRMGAAGPSELFFIVAVTDAIGGDAMSKRIREQWDCTESIRQAGLTLAISYRQIQAIKRNGTETMQASLESSATVIQQLMNEEISSRMARNGQDNGHQENSHSGR
jgi:signal transduction histidine kinase